MKTIPLADAIEILAACSAVIVDDTCVTFPNIFNEPEEDTGIFLEIDNTVAIERFKSDANKNPTVDMQGRIVLVNTRGEQTKLMPLVASPVE